MSYPEITVEVAFESDFYATPTWTDVTDYCMSFDSRRGRGGPLDVCQPGTASFVFDNTSGDWDPDDTAGPWYGHLRPNKLIRASVEISGTTYRLFTGYVDSLRRTWPEGVDSGVCTVQATDRFKQLTRATITTTRGSETADARISALLSSVAFKTINPDGYSARTLIGLEYEDDDILLAAQDAARSDGGLLFCDSSGTVVFQTATFRQTNTRATASQATFGTATGIRVQPDLEPAVDDLLMANTVRLTDGHGVKHWISDTVAAGIDGDIELDLGSTLLDISSQADDRAIEVLNLMIDAKPRYEQVTFDAITEAGGALQAVTREISDRITVALVAPGHTTGTARQQWIESVEHAVVFDAEPQWLCTFGLSGLPGDASNGRTAI